MNITDERQFVYNLICLVYRDERNWNFSDFGFDEEKIERIGEELKRDRGWLEIKKR